MKPFSIEKDFICLGNKLKLIVLVLVVCEICRCVLTWIYLLELETDRRIICTGHWVGYQAYLVTEICHSNYSPVN